MIIYKDSDGNERIIRSDEIIKVLIKNGTINSETLLKRNVNDDEWIMGSDYELFNQTISSTPKLKKDSELELKKLKEIANDYWKAIKDDKYAEIFKNKWEVIGLTNNKPDLKGSLIKDSVNFNKTNFWGLIVNDNWNIYAGRTLHSNIAAVTADNNRWAKELFEGVYEITEGEEFITKEAALAKEKNGVFQIQTLGRIQIPKKSTKSQEETGQIKEKQTILEKARDSKEEMIETSVPKTKEVKTEDKENLNYKTENIKKIQEDKTHIETQSQKVNAEKARDEKNKKREIIYESLNFFDAIKICLSKYADFSGRARRKEYWYFTLFLWVTSFLLGFIEGYAGAFPYTQQSVFANIFGLAVLIPALSNTARRLHDVNRSGWWMLIPLTFIGLIPFYYWMFKKSDPEKNNFGENPMIKKQ